MALAAGANWAAFDGTRTGLILGALLAVGAPVSETFIVNVLGWWHYDRPDFFGVPHWAGAPASFSLFHRHSCGKLQGRHCCLY